MLFLKALGSKNRREDHSRQNRNESVVCTGKSQANMVCESDHHVKGIFFELMNFMKT